MGDSIKFFTHKLNFSVIIVLQLQLKTVCNKYNHPIGLIITIFCCEKLNSIIDQSTDTLTNNPFTQFNAYTDTPKIFLPENNRKGIIRRNHNKQVRTKVILPDI